MPNTTTDAAAPDAAPGSSASDAETGTVAQAVTNSPQHTMLARAVSQTGLDQTLGGAGPFTVFAPTDEAFSQYGPTIEQLMQPAAEAQLTQILTYHVVPQSLDAAALTAQAQAGGGTTTLTTVEGSTLTVTDEDGALAITDERGGKIYVATADLRQSNGIVHVTNGVLFPRPEVNAAAGAEPAAGGSTGAPASDATTDEPTEDAAVADPPTN